MSLRSKSHAFEYHMTTDCMSPLSQLVKNKYSHKGQEIGYELVTTRESVVPRITVFTLALRLSNKRCTCMCGHSVHLKTCYVGTNYAQGICFLNLMDIKMSFYCGLVTRYTLL